MRRLRDIIRRRDNLGEVFKNGPGGFARSLESFKGVPKAEPTAILIYVEGQEHARGIGLDSAVGLVIQDKVEIHERAEERHPVGKTARVKHQFAVCAK